MAVARTLSNEGTRYRFGHSWFARATVATVTATVVAGTAILGAGHAVAATVPPRDGTEQNAPLAELARADVDPGSPAAAAIVGLSSSGADSLQTDSTNRLAVTVRFSTTPADTTIEAIVALNTEVLVSKRHAAASVLVDPARLPELADIPALPTTPTTTPTTIVPAQTGPTALAATGAHTNVLGGFGLAALAAGLLTTGLVASGLVASGLVASGLVTSGLVSSGPLASGPLVPALAVRRRASRR